MAAQAGDDGWEARRAAGRGSVPYCGGAVAAGCKDCEEDDARYWFQPGVDSHKYSDALVWTVQGLTFANEDTALGTALLLKR